MTKPSLKSAQIQGKIPSVSLERFDVKTRLISFVYAGRGVVYLLKTQQSAWIHVFMILCVTVFGIIAQLSIYDWRWILLCMGLVLTAEAFNTSLEAICDLVSPDFHPLVKIAKDVAAGGVLIASLFSALIGWSIFSPFIKEVMRAVF